MKSQSALFIGMEQGSPEPQPRGFRYQRQIISEEEETHLVSELDRLDLKPFEFHGYLGNRRVINFGLKYDFSHRAIDDSEEGDPDFNTVEDEVKPPGFPHD